MVGLMVYQYAAIVYFYFSIGRLESIKQALYELVILPLWKPELFSHEKLLGPQKGVLLYGTPGTGKTMLAKAIIREFGAVFINMRISNLMSKWFGDAQKLGSCTQDAVGSVLLKGLSLSASTREKQSSFGLQVFGTWMYRYCPLLVNALIRIFFVARLMAVVLGTSTPLLFLAGL
ncbi:hypothetical protein NC651_027929 [Populus alba x Populus x berolinensis]|nr:hypothetical protein NC651_027929 [Populus alba x Populus x berolinensis]